MKKTVTYGRLLFVIVFVLSVVSVSVFADIGNAFDDGGGFDYGFGDDYGYDFGDDYGDDFDDDYGDDFGDGYGDDYDNNDYDYDSSVHIPIINDNGDDDESISIPVAALVIVLIIIFLAMKRKAAQNGTHSPVRQQNSGTGTNLYREAVVDEESIIAELRKNDPDFSASDFKAYVEDCYLKLTEAWEARDWAIARNFESDTLFHIHRRQLEEYVQQKKTNHMDGQCVLSKTLTNYKNDGKTETLVVKLNATVIDYVTDDATGNVLSGSKTQRLNRWYRLEFIRTAGTKTQADRGLTSHECPSCGAPLNLNATGRCEYCQNVITSGDYTWVMNAYGRWN